MKKHQRRHCIEIIEEVLRYWDPIGAFNKTTEGSLIDNEYDSYAPGVLSALERGKNAKGIGSYLAQIRSVSIGIGSSRPSEREKEIGEKLVAWRDGGYKGGAGI